MTVSIFTTQTNAPMRGDNVADALECYTELADETIIVEGSFPETQDGLLSQDGDKEHPEFLMHHWPREFSWPFIGEQFQRGYEACTGDWVVRMDLDMLFHEKDFMAIRKAMRQHSNSPALSFWKYQFILPDRYWLKSRVVIAVNKAKYGDRIKFNSGGDLCQPSLDGKYISPNDVPEAKVPFYNYEKILKTKDQIADDVGRMERAYKRHFGHTQYGSNGRDAYKKWLAAQVGKFNKPQEHIKLSEHPKYIQKTIEELTPDNFGFNGHNKLEVNDYAQSLMRI